MPSQTSSPRAYGLRAQSGRTAYSLAAILASLSITPAYAVASHDTGVVSKKVDREKPGKVIERDDDDEVDDDVVAPVPSVQAPTVTPAPTAAPAPARTQAPKPAATPKRKPAPTPKPKPAPTPKPAASAPQVPRSTPQAPVATPDRAPTPAGDERASGESREDGTGIGATPGAGGSGPAATPGSGATAPARRRAPAPRVRGGLIDIADRAAGNGGGGRSAPARSRGTAGPVTYREDAATGRRVYAVPTPDGRRRRQVSVPGGVFGALPSAAIEATSEVRGATEEGGTRRPVASGSESDGPSGVAETITQPLAAIDEATGVSIPVGLAIALVVAMAGVVALGIRRERHRW